MNLINCPMFGANVSSNAPAGQQVQSYFMMYLLQLLIIKVARKCLDIFVDNWWLNVYWDQSNVDW